MGIYAVDQPRYFPGAAGPVVATFASGCLPSGLSLVADSMAPSAASPHPGANILTRVLVGDVDHRADVWPAADTARGRILVCKLYAVDEDVVDIAERADVANMARAQWRREHIDAIDAAAIHDAITAQRAADAQLDAAVEVARRKGLSWAKVGATAGISATGCP